MELEITARINSMGNLCFKIEGEEKFAEIYNYGEMQEILESLVVDLETIDMIKRGYTVTFKTLSREYAQMLYSLLTAEPI